MEERGGVPVRPSTIGIADLVVILSVIMLLSGMLGKIFAVKKPELAARVEDQMRTAAANLSLNLIAPGQAVAGAPPGVMRDDSDPRSVCDVESLVAPLPPWSVSPPFRMNRVPLVAVGTSKDRRTPPQSS